MKSYSKKRAIAQQRTNSFKYVDIAPGTKLSFTDVVEDSIERDGQEIITDFIMTNDDAGRTIKLPVREFLNMNLEGDAKHYESESGSDAVKLPEAITVVSSEDRTDREGNTIFPVHAYNAADEFLSEGSDMEWADLVASGLKEDNKLSAVQNYTVKLS